MRLACVSLGLLVCGASAVAQIFDVELHGTWFKRENDWCVRIDVPAPHGARVSTERMRIEATDARTGEPLRFRVDVRGSRRRGGVIELRFAIDRPRNVSISVRGLDVRDASGRTLVYNPQLTVNAPPAIADEHPRATPPIRAFTAGPGAGEPPSVPGQGAPPPMPLIAPRVDTEPSGGAAPPVPPPSAPRDGKIDIPQFPFPPPRASALENVPRDLLVAANRRPRLRDVKNQLAGAFDRADYRQTSYYAVPDGFAMASQLEQINADGTPARDRWSLDVPVMQRFSIGEYVHALFRARPGHYRVVVFIVTNHPFKQKDAKVTRDDARAWVDGGLNDLPQEIGERAFTNEYVCTALIYEFKSAAGSDAALMKPSEVSAHEHLQRSGLLAALQPAVTN